MTTTTDILLIVAISFALTLTLTPAMIRICRRFSIVDRPNGRKIHSEPVPRLGGCAVAAGFFGGATSCWALASWSGPASALFPAGCGFFIAGQLLIVIIGILDDIRSLGPAIKLAAQSVAAGIAYAGGFRIETGVGAWLPWASISGITDFFLTVFWITGITNAFNLIDGLDGLASGVAIIAGLTTIALAGMTHQVPIVMLSLALAGAALGFLPYNFRPARIFLGDSGSLFLGFTLATLSLRVLPGMTSFTTAGSLILTMGLPVLDTFLAILRRLLLNQSGPPSFRTMLRHIGSPDRNHIHHRLLSAGISHRDAVILLYMTSLIFGAAAIGLQFGDPRITMGAVILVMSVVVIGVWHLRYHEFCLIRNGVLLEACQALLAGWKGIIVLVDSCTMLASMIIAETITAGISGTTIHRIIPMIIGTAAQSLLLWSMGLYKRPTEPLGLGDALAIAKLTVKAGLISPIIMAILCSGGYFPGVWWWGVEFYLLLASIIGIRMIPMMLRFTYRRNLQTGRRVLIYGAGHEGRLVLDKLLGDPEPRMTPVGFVDDSVVPQARWVNGYPVFGGYRKVRDIIRKERIQFIIIAMAIVNPVIIDNIFRIATENDCAVEWADVKIRSVPVRIAEQLRAAEGAARE